MSHVRTQIRDAVTDLLLGLPTTGNNVFKSRIRKLSAAELPALTIETNDETIDMETTTDDYVNFRTLDLVIRANAKVNADLDNVLDACIQEVEETLFADIVNNTLASLVKDIELKAIKVQMNNEGDQPIGEAAMLWTVNYFTRGNAPDVSIQE